MLNPDNLPFTILDEVELQDEPYQFDLVMVVESDGKLYVAGDSGCSCPEPFEDHTFPTDFTEVRSWADVAPFTQYASDRSAVSRLRQLIERETSHA